MAASEGQPDHDTLSERGRSDPHVFRLLVTMDRGILAGLFLLFVPAALLLGGLLHPNPFELVLVRRGPIQGLYQALVISTVTGATLVLTLSQLVLSEEFGPVGEQRQRMEQAIAFRRDVEHLVSDGTRSATPLALLGSLLEAIYERASELETTAASAENEELASAIQAYLGGVRRDARITKSMLETSRFGTVETVKAVFSFDLSAVLEETGRLRSMAGGSRSELVSILDELEERLEVFGSARAHLKVLYFEKELGDLSRWIIYTSFPAIVVAVASLLFFDPTAIDSGWISLTIASVTISIALTPFAILLAYILRIVKISQITFTRSPFLVREG